MDLRPLAFQYQLIRPRYGEISSAIVPVRNVAIELHDYLQVERRPRAAIPRAICASPAAAAACIEKRPRGRALLERATVPPQVQAKQIELVGQYAILIQWSNGHSTGISNFRELRANCPFDACVHAPFCC
jgi:DUF971 family protein